MPALSGDGRIEPEAIEAVKKAFIPPDVLAKLPGNDALYTEKFLR
jgi:hypothetical protein